MVRAVEAAVEAVLLPASAIPDGTGQAKLTSAVAAGVGRRAELEWYRMRHRSLTHIVTYLAVLAWRVWLPGLSSGLQPDVYPNRHSLIQQVSAGYRRWSLGQQVDEAGEDLGQRRCRRNDAGAHRCVRARAHQGRGQQAVAA